MLNHLMFWKSKAPKTTRPAKGRDEPISDEMRTRLLILAIKNGQTRPLRGR